MKIDSVIAIPILGGWWHSDLAAIRAGARKDGFFYHGKPVTPGFSGIREPATGLGVGLVLESGYVCWGDCVAEVYPGRPGRDPHHTPAQLGEIVANKVAPKLCGADLRSFRSLMSSLDNEDELYASILYGFSHAALAATAYAMNETMAETVAREFGTELAHPASIKFNLQMGPDRGEGVDKVIMREAEFIHTGSVYTKELFAQQLDYLHWIGNRIQLIGDANYSPAVHIDQYGHVGRVLGNDPDVVVDYLQQMGEAISPYRLVVEDPVNLNSREEQAMAMAEIRKRLDAVGGNVLLLADEYCSTIEDHRLFAEARAAHYQKLHAPDVGGLHHSAEIILMLKDMQVMAYFGGSASDTDLAAKARAHVALATSPEIVSASPGMGIDEAHSIMFNEMQRAYTIAGLRNSGSLGRTAQGEATSYPREHP